MGDHTPTPWTANPDGWQPWQGAIQIVGADGYVVAYTATGGPEKENADLLCKAASNHDALVKALEADITDLEYHIGNPSAWDYYDDSMSERLRKVVNRAREALGKASA